MKRKIYFLVATFVSSFLSFECAAASTGTVSFEGTIKAAACTISSDSADQTVNFNEIDLSDLTANNNTGVTPIVSFDINLQGCAGANAVTATFTGTPATGVTGALAITGTARNACIVLFNKDGTRLLIDTISTPQAIAAGNNTLKFGAAVSGLGLGDAPVPGAFSATSTFALQYQ